MKMIFCSGKNKSLFKSIIIFCFVIALVGCETGKSPSPAKFEAQPFADSTPLDKSYQEIVVFELESSTALKKDYAEWILECRDVLIKSLIMKKKYRKVEPGHDATPCDGKQCLLVKIKLNDMWIATFWTRRGAGNPWPSYMYMHMKLVDAATQKVVREEDFNGENSGWGAIYNFGLTDRSLPSDMGKIMADYIEAVVPNTKPLKSE